MRSPACGKRVGSSIASSWRPRRVASATSARSAFRPSRDLSPTLILNRRRTTGLARSHAYTTGCRVAASAARSWRLTLAISPSSLSEIVAGATWARRRVSSCFGASRTRRHSSVAWRRGAFQRVAQTRSGFITPLLGNALEASDVDGGGFTRALGLAHGTAERRASARRCGPGTDRAARTFDRSRNGKEEP
jgi:hypothetical protein